MIVDRFHSMSQLYIVTYTSQKRKISPQGTYKGVSRALNAQLKQYLTFIIYFVCTVVKQAVPEGSGFLKGSICLYQRPTHFLHV